MCKGTQRSKSASPEEISPECFCLCVFVQLSGMRCMLWDQPILNAPLFSYAAAALLYCSVARRSTYAIHADVNALFESIFSSAAITNKSKKFWNKSKKLNQTVRLAQNVQRSNLKT